MGASFPTSALALGLILMTLLAGQCYGGKLSFGFYKGKCGKNDVEKIITNLVKESFKKEPDTVSDLIRLAFHDCFVGGCDASIFLDGPGTEKAAEPSSTLGGFDIVDEIKAGVEKVCPGVVSCADLLMMGARSGVVEGGGKWFEVETGRRDGLVSLEREAEQNMPGPKIPVPAAIKLFKKKGLSKDDFVVLLGGHTVGTAHCHSFKNRLYNFRGTGGPDPTLSPALLEHLRSTCPLNSNVDNEAFLDQTPNSEFKFNNDFYKQIVANNGTLEIDQQLAIHQKTKGVVKGLSKSPFQFVNKFGPAFVKMGRIGVLTGNKGEIRRSCRARN